MDDAPRDGAVFSIIRDRPLDTDFARQFFLCVLRPAEWQCFVSDDGRLSFDGAMIEAWACNNSFVPEVVSAPDKPAEHNPVAGFKGKARSNATHQSAIVPQARPHRNGEFAEAKLHYMTSALSQNRNGRVVDMESTQATKRMEWETAIRMIVRSVGKPSATGSADKGNDTAQIMVALERRGIKAHVGRKVCGGTVDRRTVRGKGDARSLRRLKIIEEAFGWIKTVGSFRKTRHKRLEKRSGQALFAFAAYNLTRMLSLM